MIINVSISRNITVTDRFNTKCHCVIVTKINTLPNIYADTLFITLHLNFLTLHTFDQ